jgi:serine/threonine-protein kinase
MAKVYKAEQPSLDRLVAIKELRAELAQDQSVITRFEREAKYVAALAHQNIVHIYDFVTRAHAMYIVMELVEGIDLFSLMSRVKRVPPDVAALLALQAARALEYAHYRGVVHRDFKPSNLMVTRHGEVKLMDFGIARDASYDDLTRPGIALGTPSYMSPEQILGERVDARSDIFSFGIVLYQMLTGQKPFAEDDTRSVMNHILHGPYARPRSLFPDIPWRLQRIVRRCLEKRPADRYGRTEELRRDLERYVAERVPVNPNGRVVLYLHNCQLITREDAKTYVHPEELEAPVSAALDAGAIDPRAAVLRPTLQMNAAVLLILGLWTACVSLANLGTGVGYLSVSARPWAEVYIDGRYYDVTPVQKPITLPPGPHTVEFRNKFYEATSKQVQVGQGEVTKVSVELSKPHN